MVGLPLASSQSKMTQNGPAGCKGGSYKVAAGVGKILAMLVAVRWARGR